MNACIMDAEAQAAAVMPYGKIKAALPIDTVSEIQQFSDDSRRKDGQ